MEWRCRALGDRTIFKVHLTPRSSRDEINGLHGDALKIKIKAPPVEGRANQALIKFLAKKLGVPPGDVEIVAGQTGRTKLVAVRGVSPRAAAALSAG